MNAFDLPDETLFAKALECRTPEERAVYLAQVCAGKPELRRQLEELLAAHDGSGEFLEPLVAAERPTITLDLAPEESSGTLIGRYKLLQKIGEGGMGVVYMAEQTEPVVRKVALKIIKLGMDTKAVVARFEAERQALALMDHPNIAKVLDAGATNAGRPYFVMELVHGVPITDYCDRNKLTTKERLELFIPVCQAIQHAHQKGIIHRDIKPSNVMVTLHDGVPVPKVIDFGVAKATNQRLTEKTLFTNYAQMIGTPVYMSPEQAEMSGLDIDTRSDIYSLGVLLYELLTGSTPFTTKELLSKGYAEMQRIIVEQEPVRPSTRMSTLREEEKTVMAKNRGMDVAALRRGLQGDLDWIVMKCLEKDRMRRYETSNGLAADLRRHLSNELITARPPTTGYLLKKLIKRNRLAFAAASAVAAASLVGFGGATWQYYRERAAHQRAVAAERQQEELRKEAEAFRRQAEAQAYASDMAFASESANLGLSLGAVDKLLSHWRGRTPDLREWEWFYQNGICHRESLSFVADSKWLRSVAWSPDGKRLASGGGGREVRIWDAATGRKVMELLGHSADVRSVAWSLDGKRLASASSDGTVKIWDPDLGAEILTYCGHTGTVFSVAWNPDGKTLASGAGSPGGAVKLWHADTGVEIETRTTADNVYSVSWNRSGTRLAFSGAGFLRIWEPSSGKEMPFPAGPARQAVAWSPDGQWLVNGDSDHAVRISNSSNGTNVFTGWHSSLVESVAWSPDGTSFASASRGDGEVKIWDPVTGKAKQSFRGHLGAVRSVSWSPDGKRIASAGGDGVIKIWNVDETSPTKSIVKMPDSVFSLAWNPDGRHLAYGCSDGSVWISDTMSAAEPLRLAGHSDVAWRVAWNPTGTMLASGDNDGVLKLWQWPGGRLVWTLKDHPGETKGLAWSPDGTRVATSGGRGSRLHIREASTGKLTSDFDLMLPGGALTLAWSPDGRQLATGRYDLFVLELPDGRTKWRRPGHPDFLRGVTWSPDGKKFATASDDTTVRVWDAATGAELQTLPGHGSQVTSVAWSPNGSRLASASTDQTVRIWDPTAGRMVSAFGSGVALNAVEWSPDGRRLAYSTVNGEVIILDATPGFELERKRTHTP